MTILSWNDDDGIRWYDVKLWNDNIVKCNENNDIIEMIYVK